MWQLSISRLILKRLADDRKLLISVFLGIAIAVTLGAAAPVYLRSLEQLAYTVALDRISRPYLNVAVFASQVPLNEPALDRIEELASETL